MQFYRSGVFTTLNKVPNHGVTLMGYNATADAYLIKNSWGAGWGNQGYGFIDQSVGVCNYAMYPILPNEGKPATPCSPTFLPTSLPNPLPTPL